jgi:hypothetical protein
VTKCGRPQAMMNAVLSTRTKSLELMQMKIDQGPTNEWAYGSCADYVAVEIAQQRQDGSRRNFPHAEHAVFDRGISGKPRAKAVYHCVSTKIERSSLKEKRRQTIALSA